MKKEYCNIVAKKAGTIAKIIAQKGTAKVNVGDKVEEKQVLIQGTMEENIQEQDYVHSLER